MMTVSPTVEDDYTTEIGESPPLKLSILLLAQGCDANGSSCALALGTTVI